MKYWHAMDELGLNKTEDKDLEQFIFEFQTTGVKFGGALDGIAEGRPYLTIVHRRLSEARAGSSSQIPGRTGSGGTEKIACPRQRLSKRGGSFSKFAKGF